MLGFQKTWGYHKKACRSESVHDLEILNTEQEMKQRLIHSKYNEKIFNIKVLKPRKFYIRRNSSKVNSVESECIVTVDFLP